jgi:Zn finger protein HypA/HybF involved in hydrogenase expression
MKKDTYNCMECGEVFDVEENELIDICPFCNSEDIIFEETFEEEE